ncbi:MEDS domain-containing protein [Streptomyces sp. NPDC127097]|uniref:MEDS domain-containing protein n=1 Tax=Streptomyces sp. NPDC127097 TaxID=3347136 RepID=UPI00366735A3
MHRRTADTPVAAVAHLGGVPLTPGDHICALYRGRAERDQLMIPFLAEGLSAGHICLLLGAEGDGCTFRDVLASHAPAVAPGGNSLQIRGPNEYLRDGTFDGDRALARLSAWSDEMFPSGNDTCARLVADMSWAQPLVQPAFVQGLVRYEMHVTRWLRSYPQVGMCMYDLETFHSDLIVPLIKAHPKVWLKGMIMENPYFLDPDEETGPPAPGET